MYLLLLQRFWQLMQSEDSVWGRAVYMPPPWQRQQKYNISTFSFTLADTYIHFSQMGALTL